MKRWEYRVISWDKYLNHHQTTDLETVLDELGDDGWELVNIIPQIDSNSNVDFQLESVETKDNILVFKRQLD